MILAVEGTLRSLMTLSPTMPTQSRGHGTQTVAPGLLQLRFVNVTQVDHAQLPAWNEILVTDWPLFFGPLAECDASACLDIECRRDQADALRQIHPGRD